MRIAFIDLETIGLPDKISFHVYYPYQESNHYEKSRIVQVALIVYDIEEITDVSEHKKTDIHNTNQLNNNLKNAAHLSELDKYLASIKYIEDRTNRKQTTTSIQYTLVAEYDYIIKPDGFQIENSHLHDIEHKMAEFVGIKFVDVIALIKPILTSCDMLVAHNIMFDKNVLLSELFRYKLYDVIGIINQLKEFCTSLGCTHITKIPFNKHKFKQPKLLELYRFLFKKDIEKQHNALYDTRAMAECFIHLHKNKLILFDG